MTEWILGTLVLGFILAGMTIGFIVIVGLFGLTVTWLNRRHSEVHGEDTETHPREG